MDNPLYIAWNQENNLGITIIDEQHRGIVATINSFHYCMQKGFGCDAVKPTLDMLVQYTLLHFKTEEALLEETGYGFHDKDMVSGHIALHRELMRRTIDIARNPKTHEDPRIALNFLREWWLHHINAEDRKYVAFVREKI